MIKKPVKLPQKREFPRFQISRSRQERESIDNRAKRRLAIVLVMGLLSALMEMIAHYEPANPDLFQPDFWRRLPVLTLVLPLATWILLELLEQGSRVRSEAKPDSDQRAAPNQGVLNSAQYNGLVEEIVHYHSAVIPVNGAALFLHDGEQAAFKLAGVWRPPGKTTSDFPAKLSPDDCTVCPSAQSPLIGSFTLCPHLPGLLMQRSTLRHCTSLMYHGRLAGLLQLDLPADSAPSSHLLEALNQTLPQMALVLSKAGLQLPASNSADAALAAERRLIFQDLHDSLAQNIGYLRLKLNQFATADFPIGSAEARHDIEYMRDAANEAFEQIRGTLASLKVAGHGDLVSHLRDRARLISERAGLDIRVVCLGESYPLTPQVHQQVLNIVREALNNVERHASAEAALVQLAWEKNELTVEIEDDGVGFDPDGVQAVDHLGLSVMCQRARSINGKVSITSAPGSGTRVILRLPI